MVYSPLSSEDLGLLSVTLLKLKHLYGSHPYSRTGGKTLAPNNAQPALSSIPRPSVLKLFLIPKAIKISVHCHPLLCDNPIAPQFIVTIIGSGKMEKGLVEYARILKARSFGFTSMRSVPGTRFISPSRNTQAQLSLVGFRYCCAACSGAGELRHLPEAGLILAICGSAAAHPTLLSLGRIRL